MATSNTANRAINYIALIPAYEPDEKLLTVIDELSRTGFEIVVVDDGSGPEYSGIFREAGCRYALRTATAQPTVQPTIISYEQNMGKGAALRTGLAYIYDYRIKSACDSAYRTIVVTVDADGQHLAKDVLRVARAAAVRPGTLVLGSRGLDSNSYSQGGADGSTSAGDEGIPLRSRLGNTITRHVFRFSTGLPIHDTQTGLRAFSADLIPRMLSIGGSRYEYEINMLLDFAAAGIPVREERIDTVYIEDNSSSHFDAVRDSFRVYREILRFSASSLIGFAVDYVMFALLSVLLPSLAAANIGARLVSSITNYTINRKFVFGSSKKVSTSALQYFALAAVILAGNTVVLAMLVGTLGLNSLLAKILTELIFFTISWTVQRYLIFYREETGAHEQAAGPAGDRREAEAGDDGSVRFIVGHRAVRTPKLRAVRADRIHS